MATKTSPKIAQETQHTVRYVANVLVSWSGGYWGAGWTPEEAARKCLSHVPSRDKRSKKNRYSIVRFSAHLGRVFSVLGGDSPRECAACWVDGEGMLCSRWSAREALPEADALATFKAVGSK